MRLRGWTFRVWRPQIQPHNIVHWLVSISTAISIGMLVLGGAVLVGAHQDAWHQAELARENLLVMLEHDIRHNFELVDLSIRNTITAQAQPELGQAGPTVRHLAMFGSNPSIEYLGRIVLMDADGNVTATSAGLDFPPLNAAEREYFQIHKARSDVGLFISRPFISKVREGDPVIALSRRISGPDGAFLGVAVGVMRLAYFHDMFAKLELGENGSITIFRDDGPLIMRRPFRAADIGGDLSVRRGFAALVKADHGTFVATASLDGVRRVASYRHVGDLPIILTVNTGVDDIYAAWRRKAVGIGVVLAVLCCSTMGLCLLCRAELLRRMTAETALRKAAARLKVMATTDNLTGLRNRRAFVEALSREWLRAIRNQTQITVLLLNADWLKFFNERYGHPAGDRVLQQIARCIEASLLRPVDAGARYGGEEFIVLLPETDLSGAGVVAERIRAAVESLDIPHDASPYGKVTISGGVAVACPVPGDVSTSLMQDADRALHQAKNCGRNHIVLADGGSRPDPILALVAPLRHDVGEPQPA